MESRLPPLLFQTSSAYSSGIPAPATWKLSCHVFPDSSTSPSLYGFQTHQSARHTTSNGTPRESSFGFLGQNTRIARISSSTTMTMSKSAESVGSDIEVIEEDEGNCRECHYFILTKSHSGLSTSSRLRQLLSRFEALDLTGKVTTEVIQRLNGGCSDIFVRRLVDGTIIAEKVIRFFSDSDLDKTTKVCLPYSEQETN